MVYWRDMIITYGSGTTYKIQVGDTVLAYNPHSKQSKHAPASFGADVALVSLNHPDMNGVEVVSRGDKNPFVISGPGEYEIQGISIRGFGVPVHYEDTLYYNTVYRVVMETMQLCFLGVLTKTELPAELLEDLDDIDILFVPVGSSWLSPKDAQKLIVSLEPKIIIPMYEDETSLASLLKESGKKANSPIDKYVVKKKDCTEQKGSIIVLTSV